MSPHIRAGVSRPRINDEQTPARFPKGTLARIDAVLPKGQKRSDFIRAAVEAELSRLENDMKTADDGPKGQIPRDVDCTWWWIE